MWSSNQTNWKIILYILFLKNIFFLNIYLVNDTIPSPTESITIKPKSIYWPLFSPDEFAYFCSASFISSAVVGLFDASITDPNSLASAPDPGALDPNALDPDAFDRDAPNSNADAPNSDADAPEPDAIDPDADAPNSDADAPNSDADAPNDGNNAAGAADPAGPNAFDPDPADPNDGNYAAGAADPADPNAPDPDAFDPDAFDILPDDNDANDAAGDFIFGPVGATNGFIGSSL